MIPSRPLSLSDIIAETIRIYAKAFPRYALLFAILILPGAALLTIGATEFAQDTVKSAQSALRLSDSDATIARNDVRNWLHKENPFFAPGDRLMTGDTVITSIDSIPTTPSPRTRAIRDHLLGSFSRFGDSSMVLTLAVLLLLVGGFTLLASSLDLSSQLFEERPMEAKLALKNAIKGSAWWLLLLYLGYSVLNLLVEVILGALPVEVAGTIWLFFLIALIYAMIRLVCTFPAIVSEELKPVEGMRRSWQLTQRFGGRVIALSIGFALFLFVLFVITSIVAGLLFPYIYDWMQQFLFKPTISTEWVIDTLPAVIRSFTGEALFFGLLLLLFFPAFATVLYYDLRTRHDGPLVYVDEVEH